MTTLLIFPTPAGPWAFGSKIASTCVDAPGASTTLIEGIPECPGTPKVPNFQCRSYRCGRAHARGVVVIDRDGLIPVLVTEYLWLTFPVH